jgi:ornithine cyclodeaminase/alanine dehydrogenase
MEMTYLSRADVEAIALPMARVIDVVSAALIEKASGLVQMPPKMDLHPRPSSFLHAMPAHLPSSGATGLKWVSGYPRNAERGLPYISGLVILNESETGIPVGVLDATWITGVRTGACTAVTARALARPDASVLAVLGCGVQGRTNAEALKTACPSLVQLSCFDTVRENAERYAGEMARFGYATTVCATPEEAVIGADVIVTAGPIERYPTPAIAGAWLKDGALAIPLDFDSYLRADAFARATALYTDDCAQLEHFRSIGYFSKVPTVKRDISHLLTGEDPGRTSNADVIISINLGIGLLDVAVAQELVREAKRVGIGRTLPL